MPDPIAIAGGRVDLSRRIQRTSTVSASPAAGTITTIATLTITDDLVVGSGVLLIGWAAFTVGTNGVSALLGIRQTSTTGTVVGAGNAATVVAANLYNMTTLGFDASPSSPLTNQVYVLTLTIASGSASSTVSAAQLTAIII